MKKIVLALFAMGLFTFANAQEVGIRFGGTNGAGGAAVDAVFGTGAGRIHANLGFYANSGKNDKGGVGVDVLWDFMHQQIGNEALYWYLGAGASALIGDPFLLGATGELGLEYRFNEVPLVIGFDWRPTFWLVENTSFNAGGLGLNVRYVF